MTGSGPEQVQEELEVLPVNPVHLDDEAWNAVVDRAGRLLDLRYLGIGWRAGSLAALLVGGRLHVVRRREMPIP